MGGTNGLLANAAQILASIPTYLAGDPTDNTVDTSQNSVAYCAALNTINPGICTMDLSHGGGHVGAQEFTPSIALGWINSHQ